MIILRYIGYALSSCAILLLGFETVKYLENRSIDLITVQQAWRSYDAEGLDSINNTVSGSPFPGVWYDVIETVIDLPLLAVVVVLSAFLLFLSRHSGIER